MTGEDRGRCRGYVSGSGGGGGGSPQISGKLRGPLRPVLALSERAENFSNSIRVRAFPKTSFSEGFLYTSGLNETFGNICASNNVKAFKYIFKAIRTSAAGSRVSV